LSLISALIIHKYSPTHCKTGISGVQMETTPCIIWLQPSLNTCTVQVSPHVSSPTTDMHSCINPLHIKGFRYIFLLKTVLHNIQSKIKYAYLILLLCFVGLCW